MANPEKGYFESLINTAKDNFKIAKEGSLGKGAISATKNITGYDPNNIDGSNPDGVHAGSKKNGNVIKSKIVDGKEVDQTQLRAKSTDEPFTVVSGKAESSYYNQLVQSEQYTPTGANDEKKTPISVGKRPYSVFNKYSLVNYRGTPLNISGEKGSINENGFGSSSPYQTIDPNTLINPTVTTIIEITGAVAENYGYRYQYSDFALATYFGKIPNNLLITLRRFAYPAGDDIITPMGLGKDGTMVAIQQPDIARAVTWLGEAPGNNIADILKFSHGFNWKQETSAMQTITPKTAESTGKVGNVINNSTILSAAANAAAGRDAIASNSRKQNAGYDSFSETYPNHVFGPLNVIKDVLVREQGLRFEQEFTLKFEYSLRAFEGANPKVMMLDQLANILALTYNTAPFWGGSVRYVSDGSVAKPLGNLKKLQSGDYLGFAGSIMEDLGKSFQGALGGIGDLFTTGSFKGLKNNKFLNNLVGGMGMELFNTPQGQEAIKSLLTGDPTGQWHVTIGNPLNPIMVIGNLCMQNCEITFEGANTLQDFPEKMVVVITLKPGRPRDKAEIESMFNSGRGRFYVQPDDGADINKTVDVSAYGNKDKEKTTTEFTKIFRKISNG